MTNARECKGRFSQLVNSQELPLRLLNFFKVNVLRLRHRRGKPAYDGLGTSPTSIQDVAVNGSVSADPIIQRVRDKKHALTSFHCNGVTKDHTDSDLLPKPTATCHHSSNSIQEVVNLTGATKSAFIQGCIELASPKDAAPVLKLELVFGAGFTRDTVSCYEAWVPAGIGNAGGRLDSEFRREPTRKRGRLWASDARALQGPLRRFACPYLAYDPTTYEGRKSCRGAAFSEISRLKEHLYRCHKQRPHCTQCGGPFADVSGQADHGAGSSTLVRGKSSEGFEGFNEEQEMKLKDKKRKHGESNEDKWKDIFNILFPDAIETPCPYYRSRAIEKPQDGSANPNDIKQGIIDNLFGGDQVLDIETTARSRMEKMTGSLPEEDWREMKRIFRDFAFAGMASQISVCNSSTFSASQQVPDTKLVSGQGSREVREHEDAFLLVPKHGERRVEVDDNEPTGILRRSRQPSQLSQPSQPSQPSQSRPASQNGTSPGKAEAQLTTREAAEDSTDLHLEATAETCEESVFNSLNLTPEDWQRPCNKRHLLGKDQKMTLLTTEVMEPKSVDTHRAEKSMCESGN